MIIKHSQPQTRLTEGKKKKKKNLDGVPADPLVEPHKRQPGGFCPGSLHRSQILCWMPPSSALWLQKLKSSFLRWPTLCVTVCVTPCVCVCVCVVKYQCARVTAAPLFGGGFHGNKFFGLDGQVQWSKGLNRKRQKRERWVRKASKGDCTCAAQSGDVWSLI